MIGGLGSSLSTALRTAGEARSRMDRASREIATGQRVASAKDDSAAWARATALRSENVTWETRGRALALSTAAMAATKVMLEQVSATTESLRGLVMQARSWPAGSAQRLAVQAEWDEIIDQSSAIQGENPALPDPAGVAGWSATGPGQPVLTNDSYFGATRISMWPNYGAFHGWLTATDGARPVALSTFDIAGATSAQLDDAHTSLMNVGINPPGGGLSWATSWLVNIGADEALAERWQTDIARTIDRNDRAAASLTDADLGKASAARAQSETRQQLALQTVRQALDAYGAFAGGLLGNVQRTQRGIRA